MPVVESLALIAALTQPSAQTAMTGCRIGELVRYVGSTWIFESLPELDGLLNDEEIAHDLRPTDHSYFTARKRLIELSALLDGKPEIVLDGEGGIDLEWQKDGSLLMYSCRAHRDQRDFVYFESHETYGGEDYSPLYSTERIDWFLRG